MTRRERVVAALTGRTPDRIPRAYTPVPGFMLNNPGAYERICERFPQDIADSGYRFPEGAVQGDAYAVGEYVDEWGCVFENVHAGVVGQVKHPRVASWSGLADLSPPMHLIANMDAVERSCTETDGFTLSALPIQPFERMQFLRGTEQLFKDLITQPAELFKLRDVVHEFYLAWIDAWCDTPVDALFMADDWGTQVSMLIRPKLWRELFKPLYAEYIAKAQAAGKFVYMHSDGQITAIIDDLIEIGLDALNAQVTCMDYQELHERFRGRVTFWGQMDRQHMLCFGTSDEARQAARDFYQYLADDNGSHVVAQMHIEPDAKPENIETVLEAFEQIELPARS
jgi:uroporphyrinogen-III decarboxylase